MWRADAPAPFVGSYPFRSSEEAATAARGSRRQLSLERSFTENLAMHFAVPKIAEDDPTVAQGLHYPKRWVRGFAFDTGCPHCTRRSPVGCSLAVGDLARTVRVFFFVHGDLPVNMFRRFNGNGHPLWLSRLSFAPLNPLGAASKGARS